VMQCIMECSQHSSDALREASEAELKLFNTHAIQTLFRLASATCKLVVDRLHLPIRSIQ
jgi:hypothetical protein